MAGAKSIATSMKRRYELVPQMREYDRIKYEWTPYVMLSNRRNWRSNVCNTDRHGFRYTQHNDDLLDYDAFQNYHGPKGIVCGGSTAFGVGVSEDGKTIPSLLNHQSDTTWFNFGVRAYNSTQELLLFEFYLPEVETVVLFSGVNNFVSHLGSAYFTLPYGAFCEDSYFHQLNSGTSLRRSLNQLIPLKVRRMIPIGHKGSMDLSQYEQRYEEFLNVVERDLEIWRMLRDGRGFSLLYCLQPFALWAEKLYSPEEEELFDILDLLGGPIFQILSRQITGSYKRYQEDLSTICHSKGIGFIDANKLISGEEWRFCDRVHLNDQGSMAAAAAIKYALHGGFDMTSPTEGKGT